MDLLIYKDLFIRSTLETVYMTFASTFFAYVIGLPLGILVVITSPRHLLPCKPIHSILGWLINIGRSIPFIILMVALIPFTRTLIGKSIGSTAAIVPLVIGAAPFVARLIENALTELDPSLIESAKAMGCNPSQVIFMVMLPEAFPSFIRSIAITSITLVGYSAMAGAIGGGGLGDVAIRYGYHRYEYGIMVSTILILVLLVQLIEFSFNCLAQSVDKRKKY